MSLTFLDDVAYDLDKIAEEIWLQNTNRTILVSSDYESFSTIKIYTDRKELYDEIREIGGYDEFDNIESYNFTYGKKVIQFNVHDGEHVVPYYIFGVTQEIIDLFELNDSK